MKEFLRRMSLLLPMQISIGGQQRQRIKSWALMLLGIMLSINLMADEYTMTPDGASTGSSATTYISSATSFTYDGIGWVMNQWNPSTLQVKTNQSSASSEFNFHNTTAFAGNITQVVIKFSALTLKSTSSTGFKFVGGTSVVTATTGGDDGIWDADAKTLTWTPSGNFTYFAMYQNGKVASGSNYLESSDAITVTYAGGSVATPSLTVTPTTIDFGSVNKDAAVAAKTVAVSFANLTSSSVAAGITGSAFTISPASLTADGDITITPNTTTVGTYTETLTISAADDELSKTVTVTMTVAAAFDGQKLVFDLSTNNLGLPTSKSSSEAGNYTYTLDGTDYTFSVTDTQGSTDDDGGVYFSNSYTMVYSHNAIGLPAIPGYKLVKVEANNSSGCSTSVNVAIKDGPSSSDAVIEGGGPLTWETTNSKYTYNLTETQANTSYYLYVASNKNCQITGLTLYYTAVSETDPVLTVTPSTIDFGTVDKGASVSAQTVAVGFANLSGAVSAGITGSAFSISPVSLTDEGDITITPNTATAGNYSETLTISSAADALSRTVTVTMNVVAPYSSLAEFIAGAPASNTALVLDDADNVVILGATAKYLYVQDAEGTTIILYNSSAVPAWAAGKKITGKLVGNYTIYQGMDEMVLSDWSNAEVSDGVLPTPTTLTELNATTWATAKGKYVKMEGQHFQSTALKSSAVDAKNEAGTITSKLYNTFSTMTGKTLPAISDAATVMGVFIRYSTTYELAVTSIDAGDARINVSPVGGLSVGAAVEAEQVTVTAVNGFTTTLNGNPVTDTTIMVGGKKNFTLSSSRDFYTDKTVTYFYKKPAPAPVPMNEGFEGTGFAPEEWAVNNVSGYSHWERTTSYHHTGDACAVLNGGYDQNNYLITPCLVPAAGDSLSFWVSSSDMEGRTLTVELSTTGTAPIDFTTILATYTTGYEGNIGSDDPNDFVQHTIDMSAYAGQLVYVAFHVTGEGETLCIDDVSGVSMRTESCYPIRNLNVSNIERRSMDISWTAKPGVENCHSYDLVISETPLDEDALEFVTPIIVNDTTAYHASGLTRDTHYYIYVRANCGADGTSDWRSTEATTMGLTLCDAVLCNGYEKTNTVASSYGNTYSQQIYLASELTEAGIVPGKIVSISYNWDADGGKAKDLSIYIGHTTKDHFSFSDDPLWIPASELTLVHQSTRPATGASGIQTYEFTSPFVWDGTSNIVVALMTNQTAGERHVSSGFTTYGIAPTSAQRTLYVYADTCAFDGGTPPQTLSTADVKGPFVNAMVSRIGLCQRYDACPAATNLTISHIGSSKATLSWETDGDYANTYDIILSTTEVTDFTGVTPTFTGVDTTSKQLTGLTLDTDYFVYVRCHCDGEGHDDGTSGWSTGASFKTLACVAVSDLNLQMTSKHTAAATWSTIDDEQTFEYILATDSSVIGKTPVALTDTTILLDGLNVDTKYYFFVRGVCGSSEFSSYVCQSFTTPAACPMVRNLTASGISFNTVTLSWNRGLFGEETSWIVSDGATQYTATDSTFMFFGLEPSTPYTFTVAPACATTATQSINATTQAYSTPVGDGTNTDEHIPVYGFGCNNIQRTQMIFPADMLNYIKGMSITGMTFYVASGSNADEWDNVNFNVKLGVTSQADLFLAFATDPTTIIYSGHLTANTSDNMVVNFTTPFTYTGGNLLIEFELPRTASWSTVKFYGTQVLKGSRYGYNLYGRWRESAQDFLPNVLFTCAGSPSCANKVTGMDTTEVTYSSATVTWKPVASETTWETFLSDTPLADPTTITSTGTATLPKWNLTSLEEDHDYYAYVRPVCGDTSAWNYIHFITKAHCLAPTVDSVTAITSSGATLHFTDNIATPAGQYDIVYGPAAEFDLTNSDTYTLIENVTTTAYALTGLNDAATYKVAARAKCTMNSRWSNILIFSTTCKDAYPMIFSESFDGITSGIPVCWDNSEGTTEIDDFKWKSSSKARYGHEQCLVFNSFNNPQGKTNFLRMPNVAITTNAILKFWYMNPDGGDFSVLINDSVWASNLTNTPYWDIKYYILNDLVGDTATIKFKGTSNYGDNDANIYLDDVTVKPFVEINLDDTVTYGTIYNRHGFYINSGVGVKTGKLYAESVNPANPDTIFYLNLTILPKQLTITDTEIQASKVYDKTTAAQVTDAGTLVGLVGSDVVTVSAEAAYADAQVGTAKPVTIVYTLGGAAKDNYLAPVNGAATADITALQLTASDPIVVAAKPYDHTTAITVTTPAALTNVITGDVVTLTASVAYEDAQVGTAKPLEVTYAITGADSANYLTPVVPTLTADITPIQLTIAGTTVADKSYDATTDAQTTAGTMTGVIAGDDVTVSASAIFDDSQFGSRSAAVVYTLGGADAANYLAPANDTIIAQINRKQLTISGTTVATTKTYDGLTTAEVTNEGTLSGVIGTEVVTVSATATYDNAQVGTAKTVGLTYAIAGADAANYIAPQNATTNADITAAQLTISGTVVSATKVYDGTTAAQLSNPGTLVGKMGTDDVAFTATATYADKDVADAKAVTVVYTLSGDAKDNYLAPANATLSANITPLQLTIDAPQVDASKEYDGSATATITPGALHGVIASDIVSVNATATYADKNVGTAKDVTVVYTLAGADAANYLAPVNGAATAAILAKQLTVSGTTIAAEKTYDGFTTAQVTNNGTLAGIITPDVVTFSVAAAYADATAANAKDVTLSYTIAGADAANYLAPVNGTATANIRAKQLTVSGTTINNTKEYDGTTTAQVVKDGILAGVIAPDVVSVEATATYADAAAGNAKTVNLTYAIAGADAVNYIAPVAGTTTANITAKQLTVSGTAVQSAKGYDGTTTCTVTADGILAGVVTGDNVTLTATAEYATAAIGHDKPVILTYAIAGADAANYLAPTDGATTASIVASMLTVSGTTIATSKVYDGTTTAQVITIGTLSGVESGDDVQLNATAEYVNAQAGTGKVVTVTYTLSGTDASNYDAPAAVQMYADIQAKQLTISGTTINNTKEYDGTTTAQVVKDGTLAGVIAPDVVTVSATATYADALVGDKKAVALHYTLAGADAANYLAPMDGAVTADIMAKQLTVSGTTILGEKMYDGLTTAQVTNDGTLAGIVGTDVVTVEVTATYADKNAGTAKNVTLTYAIAGADAANYLAPVNGAATAAILAKQLTVSGTTIAAEKTYDGLTTAQVTNNGTLAGIITPDVVTVEATATYADAQVGNAKVVTLTYALAGADAANYLAPVNGTATANIQAKQLTISGTTINNTKEYDGTTTAQVVKDGTLAGVIAPDVVTVSATATYADALVGDKKAVALHYTLAGADAANYLAPLDGAVTADIMAKQLTVSGTTILGEKMYDGLTTAQVTNDGTLAGIVGTDVVTVEATATYADKNAGTAKNVTLTYAIAGADAANYLAPVNGATTADILAKQLTVSGTTIAAEKTYDGLTTAQVTNNGTLAGIITPDVVTVEATATYADAQVGNAKVVTLTYALAGADAANYLAPLDGTATANIQAKQLTISGTTINNTKEYDGTTTAQVVKDGTLAGVIAPDVVTVSATAAYADANAANAKTVNLTYTISGADAANYLAPVNATAMADITPKQLTILGTTITPSRVYDGTTAAEVTFDGTLSGIVGEDQVSVSTTATYIDAMAGYNKEVTLAYTLSGANAQNYLAPVDGATTADILAKQLTISGTTIADAKVYDGNTSAQVLIPGTLDGVIATDQVNVSATATYADAQVDTLKNVTITYAITGAKAMNYLAPESEMATASITAKPLTISGTSVVLSKVYDGTDAAQVSTDGTLHGVIAPDAVNVNVTASYADAEVGQSKTVTMTYTLSGTDAHNYLAPAPKTINAGITAKELTVTGTTIASAKTYDGLTAAQITANGTVTGMIQGDDLTVTPTAEYTNAQVGTAKPVTLSYVLSGAQAHNYIAPVSTSTTADILAKQLTISGTSVASKTYDGTTTARVTDHGTLAGVVGSDRVTVTATATYADALAATAKTVNLTYAITGAQAANYIAPVSATTTADITAKTLTINGTSVKTIREYDGTSTAQVAAQGTLAGVIGSDQVTFTTRAEFTDAYVASAKTLTVSYTLAGQDAANYAAPAPMTTTGAINPRRLTISGTAVATEKNYDATTVAEVTNNGTVTGIVGSDDVTVAIDAQYNNSAVGIAKPVYLTYTLTGQDAFNYQEPIDGMTIAAIAAKPLTVSGTAIETTREYDATTAANVTADGVLSGVVSGEEVTLTATATYTDANAALAKDVRVAYTLSGAHAGNYVAPADAVLSADITPIQLTVDGTVVLKSRTYDATTLAEVLDPGKLYGVLGSDDVRLEVEAEYEDKQVGTAKTVALTYALTGNKAMNYLAPLANATTADITPAILTVENTDVQTTKVYDGTTDAEVLYAGNLVGILGADEVLLDATAEYDDPEEGADKVITVTYLLSGSDMMNYLLAEETIELMGEITSDTGLEDIREGVNDSDKVEKFWRNGHLVIRKNGIEYDATGARL